MKYIAVVLITIFMFKALDGLIPGSLNPIVEGLVFLFAGVTESAILFFDLRKNLKKG